MKSGGEYGKILRQSGLKITRQREAILEILERGECPLAAEEVYLSLREGDRAVNLSTVYRTLETMAEKDIIKKLGIVGDGRAHYEFNRNVHRHYLVCMGCKKIVAIDHCPLKAYIEAIEQQTSYTISGHMLDVYGYCPNCRGGH